MTVEQQFCTLDGVFIVGSLNDARLTDFMILGEKINAVAAQSAPHALARNREQLKNFPSNR
jgi:hypothetical protein